jgi:hypothetical protein
LLFIISYKINKGRNVFKQSKMSTSDPDYSGLITKYVFLFNVAYPVSTGWPAEGSEFESREDQVFSLLQAYGVHPNSYLTGTTGSFPGGKVAGE